MIVVSGGSVVVSDLSAPVAVPAELVATLSDMTRNAFVEFSTAILGGLQLKKCDVDYRSCILCPRRSQATRYAGLEPGEALGLSGVAGLG